MNIPGLINDCTFLDVECGTGRYSFEYRKRGNCFVVGFDMSENMIDACAKPALDIGISQRSSFNVANYMNYKPDRSSMFASALDSSTPLKT